jgi:hypothetical protein
MGVALDIFDEPSFKHPAGGGEFPIRALRYAKGFSRIPATAFDAIQRGLIIVGEVSCTVHGAGTMLRRISFAIFGKQGMN